jgi:carboxymethylenebutenolidase
VIGRRVDVPTQDGLIDCYCFAPAGSGSWPAVIVYMDAFGIREPLGEMAQRLAEGGYFVVLPNLYYRTGPVAPFDRQAVLVEGPERDRFKAMIQSINATLVMSDTAAVIDTIDQQDAARKGTIGAIGYCMGGGYALTAAATFPDRIAIAASLHGGSLATDRPDSPHRLAARMRARVYVGAAEFDPSFPPEQQQRLTQALSEAGVDHTVEVYQGTKHGFAVTGHLVYDRDASERHWVRLFELLGQAL